eukprot:TRINITY_DN66504_c0_g1_i1.p1 TRINITY_DN66504_c0_g1~~TRINITY_DN66504_c0_g1_i1.p1  ORF type:complete len:576 (+),score=153.38 TRINITY_DN66504_c0_g1_i1:82-1728(+)
MPRAPWLLAAAAAAAAAPSPPESSPGERMLGVTELRTKSFPTAGEVPWFVLWYTQATPFCRRVAPEWSALGRALQKLGVESVRLGKYDHEQPGAAGIEERHGVHGFPHIALLVPQPGGGLRAVAHEHGEQRNVAGFLRFLRANLPGPEAAALPSEEAVLEAVAATAGTCEEGECEADPQGAADGTAAADANATNGTEHWSADHWYYWSAKKDKASKLLTLAQLRRKVAKGAVLPHTLVARAGAADWRQADGVLELAEAFAKRAVQSASFEDDPGAKQRGVVALTPTTFAEVTGDGKQWMVEFYAPWCGHCQKIAADWGRLGRAVAAHAPAAEILRVGKMDGTLPGAPEAALRRGVQVQGFPTIALLQEGMHVLFSGDRTLSAFLDFIKEHTGVAVPAKGGEEAAAARAVAPGDLMPFVTELRPHKVYKDLADGRHWLVMFYASGCGFCKKLAPDWRLLSAKIAARGDAELAVGKFSTEQHGAKAVEEKYGVDGFPTLLYFPAARGAAQGVAPEEPVLFTDNRNRDAPTIIRWFDREVRRAKKRAAANS